jgi:quercetin dioxygenase-like cupin family protein
MPTTTLRHFERAPGGTHTRDFLGIRVTFLADSAGTGGAYSLMEATLRPGDEPPPHVHTAEDEAYYILDGRLTFRCGKAVTDAGPGSLVFLPRGLLHTFAVRAEPARVLVIISPGGLDGALRELCGPMPPPYKHVLDTFGRHGVRFQPPPATAPGAALDESP